MIKKYIQTSGLTLRIYSKVEIAKISSNELSGNLFSEFTEYSSQDISWEFEQITKSHGIYLEFNRAKTGNEKDWERERLDVHAAHNYPWRWTLCCVLQQR
jgi:hypothetical protein